MSEPVQLRLAGLRRQTGHTQAHLADALDATQSGVSRIERQGDLLVSTLSCYVAATGGRLRIMAEYPSGAEVEILIPDLVDPEQIT